MAQGAVTPQTEPVATLALQLPKGPNEYQMRKTITACHAAEVNSAGAVNHAAARQQQHDTNHPYMVQARTVISGITINSCGAARLPL